MQTQFKITKPIRLIELFAGIGSQAMALRDLGANFETYKVIEFDKFAIKSYNAIHNTNFPTLDIIKTTGKDLEIKDLDKYEYIMTYSFPCQDLSNIGKRAGMKKGSGTRSGLLWEVERILNELEENLPQVLLMENVPSVHNVNNINDFNKWLKFLETKGYKNYYQDLNSKDYGIPQNRKRCFMVSILSNNIYKFPQPIKLKKTVRDFLETEADNKYYLSEKMIDFIIKSGTKNFYYKPDIDLNIARPIVSTVAKMHRAGSDNYFTNRFIEYGTKTEINEIRIRQATKKGYITCKIGGVANLGFPESQRRGRVIQNGDVSPTLLAGNSNVYKLDRNYKIRRLTPLECWRLMGFNDEDFYKAQKFNSDTQLYKQAGNSIVKNVLMAIFKEML